MRVFVQTLFNTIAAMAIAAFGLVVYANFPNHLSGRPFTLMVLGVILVAAAIAVIFFTPADQAWKLVALVLGVVGALVIEHVGKTGNGWGPALQAMVFIAMFPLIGALLTFVNRALD